MSEMSYRDDMRLHQVANVVRRCWLDVTPEQASVESLDFRIARAVMAMPCDCWCCRRAGSLAE